MVQHKCVDAVGISEVFNIRKDLKERRLEIMDRLLVALNRSAVQPGSMVAVWTGRFDGHDIFFGTEENFV